MKILGPAIIAATALALGCATRVTYPTENGDIVLRGYGGTHNVLYSEIHGEDAWLFIGPSVPGKDRLAFASSASGEGVWSITAEAEAAPESPTLKFWSGAVGAFFGFIAGLLTGG